MLTVFPSTGRISTFDGPDENPLSEGGRWLGPVFPTGLFKLEGHSIMDDSLADGSGSSQAYLNTIYGPGTEAYCEFSSIWQNNSSDFWFWINGSGEGGAAQNGYQFYAAYNTGVWNYKIKKLTSGTATDLGAFEAGPTLSAGDRIGVRHDGVSSLTWYYKPLGGVWSPASGISVIYDSTYLSGHIGISKGFQDVTTKIVLFGGGTSSVNKIISSNIRPRRTVPGLCR